VEFSILLPGSSLLFEKGPWFLLVTCHPKSGCFFAICDMHQTTKKSQSPWQELHPWPSIHNHIKYSVNILYLNTIVGEKLTANETVQMMVKTIFSFIPLCPIVSDLSRWPLLESRWQKPLTPRVEMTIGLKILKRAWNISVTIKK